MHVLIINFNLDGIDHDQYSASCDELGPVFAAIPGLISKQWLASPATNTYGGVYLWKDEQAMIDYKASDIFADLSNNPSFTNVTATDFGLLEGPSRATGIS